MIKVNLKFRYPYTALGITYPISINFNELVLKSLTQLILNSSAYLLIFSINIVKYSGIFSGPTNNLALSPVYNF